MTGPSGTAIGRGGVAEVCRMSFHHVGAVKDQDLVDEVSQVTTPPSPVDI